MEKKYGKVIRRFRVEKGITLEQISSDLGIDSVKLGSYERGEEEISINDGFLLANYMEIDPYFLGIDVPLNKEVPHNLLAPVTLLKSTTFADIMKHFLKYIAYAFKKHIKESDSSTLENQLFSIDENSQYPFVYLRISILLLGVAGLSFLANSFSMLSLSLSLVVPFGLLWFLFENHHPRLIKGYELIRFLLYGGLLSIIFVYIIRFLTGYISIPFVGDLVTGIVEELGKILVVIILLRKKMVTNAIEGVLVGFAIGAGFDFIETADYSLMTYLSSGGSFLATVINLLFRSGFAIIGIGHHFWTGILGGVIVMVSKTGHLQLRDMSSMVFIFWYLLIAFVHGLFDFACGISIWFQLLVAIISLALFVMVYIKATQEYSATVETTSNIENVNTV